tara:strand:+ start:694 stop:1086 length:393 start_codon:yes stop_codon:yes gene_type:complete
MKKMKKIFCILLIASSFSAAAAPNMEQLTKSLWPWNPASIKYAKGVLLVTTKERKVSMEIYTSMISTGVCTSLFSNPNSLNDVSEVRVQNIFEKQGITFIGGNAECHELNNSPANKQKMELAARTKMGIK